MSIDMLELSATLSTLAARPSYRGEPMSVQASKADTRFAQEGQGGRVAQAIWWRVEPVVRSSAAIVLFLLLWELAPRFGLINRTFLPPFSEVVVKGVQYAAAGKLLPQIFVSLGRAGGGFGLGVVTAIPLGVLLGWYRPLEAYLNPLLQLLRTANRFRLFAGIVKLSRQWARRVVPVGLSPLSERGSCLGDVVPNCEGTLPRSATILGGCIVWIGKVKEVCNLIVNGQETLRLSGRFEALHDPFASPCR
jgi:hypothetical protein